MFSKERQKERSNYDNEVEIEGENELETCKQKIHTNEHKLCWQSHPCPSLHDEVSWKLLEGILCCCLFITYSHIYMLYSFPSVSLVSINVCHRLLYKAAKNMRAPSLRESLLKYNAKRESQIERRRGLSLKQ